MSVLNQQEVRFLIAGGLAVAAHGYGRVTFDLDLAIQMKDENIRRALYALESLGYRPILPVAAQDFVDTRNREQWVQEKNMVVFSLYSEQHPDTPVDIFASEPFDFDVEYDRALIGEIRPKLHARFVCLKTLIRMKETTGREKDREDVRQLRMLLEDENANA